MYLFETDILVHLLRSHPSVSLLAHLKGLKRSEQHISSISLGELLYLVQKSPDPIRYGRALDRFLLPFLQVVPFDAEASRRYGTLRADMEREGILLPDRSIQVASICLIHDLTLVTSMTRGWDRIIGLRFENWLDG